MKMLLKSLARNEASIVGNKTILKDMEEYENGTELLSSRDTVIDYLDVLDRLHLIENQEAYGENYRSPNRVGKRSMNADKDIEELICKEVITYIKENNLYR